MTETVGGRLAGIYITAEAGTPMRSHDSVRALEGEGLEGDRYATGTGEFSAVGGGGREITLIEREAVAAARSTGVPVDEHETRRNLVTSGVTLVDLVGRTFQVGEVVLRGVRPCPPCVHLERLTRPGVRHALKDRGGLRADIVQGGTLHVGDQIITDARPADHESAQE